jgi:hypothetical protein
MALRTVRAHVRPFWHTLRGPKMLNKISELSIRLCELSSQNPTDPSRLCVERAFRARLNGRSSKQPQNWTPSGTIIKYRRDNSRQKESNSKDWALLFVQWQGVTIVSFKQQFILTTAVSLIPITMNTRTRLFLFHFSLNVGLCVITGKEMALPLGGNFFVHTFLDTLRIHNSSPAKHVISCILNSSSCRLWD